MFLIKSMLHQINKPNINTYYYHLYGNKHLVILDLTNNKHIKLISVSDDELIETIIIDETIGYDMNNNLIVIHHCPYKTNSQDRIHKECILESYDKQYNNKPTWLKIIDKQINLLSKNALVIINPAGGNQTATLLYDTIVRKMLSVNNCKCHVYETKQQNDAHNYIKSVKFIFDFIVVMGGDGTIHEIINGILCRDDWKDINNIPIGIIPTGSGNGLAHSISYQTSNSQNIINYVYHIIRGNKLSIPLIQNYINNKCIYSFLANAWGLPSDIDSYSEYYRFLGKYRFTVGFFTKLVQLQKYNGELKYLSLNNFDDLKQFVSDGQITDKWKTIKSDSFISVWICNTPYAAEEMLVAPSIKLEEEQMLLVIIKDVPSRFELLKILYKIDKGEHIESSYVETHKILACQIKPDLNLQGNITIDGEINEYNNLECCVSGKWINIFG